MIVLGSDGAGTELKKHIIEYLDENGYEYSDEIYREYSEMNIQTAERIKIILILPKQFVKKLFQARQTRAF